MLQSEITVMLINTGTGSYDSSALRGGVVATGPKQKAWLIILNGWL